MKNFASFMVRFRIPIFIAMLAFTALCGILMPRVNINKDMTKYLSDSSNMKQGIDLMDEEFPDLDDEYYIRLQLKNVPENEKLSIKEKIKDIDYVDSVSYKLDDEDYNKDNLTLYEITTLYDYGTDEEISIEENLKNNFTTYSPVVENLSNDVSLAPYLIISVIIVLLAILFIMSASWFEPLLVLIVTGAAIVVNMGTNFFLPSVSNTTHAIAAILQLVLSLDYSVIMMNRYRQKRAGQNDKTLAMKNAFAESFPSVLSSALTTFVGLLMLVFMRYKIGADLGIVLAKGVVCSLLCIMTMLPFLILISDKILQKTKKPSLHIPMGGLAKFSNKLRYALIPIFAGIFILFFMLQRITPISFDGTPDRQIAKNFPETNSFVLLYDNKDEVKATALEAELEDNVNVTSTATFASTLDKKRDVYDMLDFFDNAGTETEMDAADLRLMYYNHFRNGEAPAVKTGALMHFIHDELLPNEKYAKEMDAETRDDIRRMIRFADKETLTDPMNFTDLAAFLEEAGDGEEAISTDDMRLMYMYYFANDDTYIPGGMTLSEFITFVKTDLAEDSAFTEYMDDADFSQITELEKFTDTAFITEQKSAAEIAAILGTDEAQAASLITMYHGLPAVESYTLSLAEFTEFLVNVVALDPSYASSFPAGSIEALAGNEQLAMLAAMGGSYYYDEMAGLLGMEPEALRSLYALHAGMYTGTGTASLVDLTDFILSTPEFSASFDETALAGLGRMQGIMQSSLAGKKFQYAELAETLGYDDPTELKNIFVLKDAKENPDFAKLSVSEFIRFLIERILSDEKMSEKITPQRAKDLRSLYLLTDSVVSEREYRIYDATGDGTPSKDDDLLALFSEMSDEADENDIYLLTMLYGSMKNYDKSWKMSVLELFDFISANVMNDPRFASVLDDDDRREINDSREDLEEAKESLRGKDHSLMLVNTKLPFESDETTAFTDEFYRLADAELENDNYKIGTSCMYKEMQESFGSEMLLITLLTIAAIYIIVAITFRNFLIPAILVAIVLCGVFITVAFSGLRGVSINYLANIIVQCILMGACIDYGILFTSYYRDNRKKSSVLESLKVAYDGSIHTVLTSGLIMVVVTGIIGFISTDPAVGPICLTLSIGSASAIILILFVLPGLLAAFDKAVTSRKDP